MNEFVKGVYKELLELQRDSLIEQSEIIERNLNKTFPLSDERDELIKLALFCSDRLKETNKSLDELYDNSAVSEKHNEEKSKESVNV